MHRRITLVAFLALFLATGLFLWWKQSPEPAPLVIGGSTESSSQTTRDALATTLVEAPDPESARREIADEEAAASDVAAPAPSAGIATLVVRVQHESGGAVAGAPVQVFESVVNEWVEGVADEHGIARFERPVAFAIESVLVRPTPTTTLARSYEVAPIALGETHEVVLLVGSGTTYSGRCVDTSGTPLAGVLVRGWCESEPWRLPHRTTVSDALGYFVIANIGPEAYIDAVDDAHQLVAGRAVFGGPASGTSVEGIEFVLEPMSRFECLVVDAAGRPLAGAVIQSYPHRGEALHGSPGVEMRLAGEFRGRSDTRGVFIAEGVPKRHFDVAVTLNGYQKFRGPLEAREERHDIVLGEGLVITGQVFDADGRPASGATVRAGIGDPGWNVVAFETDTEGRFRSTGLDPNKTDGIEPWLAVAYPGHSIGFVQPIPRDESGAVRPLEIRLERGHTIRGVVFDATGTPVGDARVSARGSRLVAGSWGRDVGSVEVAAGTGETRTGADGSFSFESLAAENYELRVIHRASYGDGEAFEVAADTLDARLVLKGGTAHVRGRVVDAFTGAPVASFMVLPMDFSWINGVDGKFEARGLDPGPLAFVVEAPGYGQSQGPKIDLVAGEQDVEFRIVPRPPLTVRILDAEREPWSGAVQVNLVAGDAAEALLGYRLDVHEQRRSGTFVLEAAPLVPLEVEVAVPGGYLATVVDLATLGSVLELVVPGAPQLAVDFVVVETDGSIDVDELVRRLRADSAADRAALDEWRRAGALRDPTLPTRIDLFVYDVANSTMASNECRLTPTTSGYEFQSVDRRITHLATPRFTLDLANLEWRNRVRVTVPAGQARRTCTLHVELPTESAPTLGVVVIAP